MRRVFSVLPLLFFALAATSFAQERFVSASLQTEPDDLPVYYSIRRSADVYTAPDSGRVYLRLGLRDQVYLLEHKGAWAYIRTQDGARGYVPTSAISNVWIHVSKSRKILSLYRGTELVKRYPADFGVNAFSDKERRGSAVNPDDWRTPEGTFFIVKKNPRSQFYKALVLNYPTAEDAERGRREGIISSSEYAAIVKAEREYVMPPMHTALGGMIEIHGSGSGVGSNWTQGCVAIHDRHIDEIWTMTDVGTPVLIED